MRCRMVAQYHQILDNEALIINDIGRCASCHQPAQSIRNWVGQAECDAGRRGDGLTTAEREELNQLRRENRQLRLDRDILSKAAAWFARETNTIPSKGSGS